MVTMAAEIQPDKALNDRGCIPMRLARQECKSPLGHTFVRLHHPHQV
jgi:hypothetical protein